MNDYLVNKEDLDAIANAINKLDRNYEQLNFPEDFINKLTNIAEYVQNLSFTVNTHRCSVTEYTPTVMQTTVVNLTVTPDDDTCFFPGVSSNNYASCVTVTGAEYTFSLSDDYRKGYLTIFNITDNVTVDIKCLKTFNIRYSLDRGIIYNFDTMSASDIKYTIDEDGIRSIDLKCSGGFTLPDDIEVENAEYSYYKSSGTVYIKNPTGDVVVHIPSGVRRITKQGDNYTLTLKEELPIIQSVSSLTVELIRENEEHRFLSLEELVEIYQPDYYTDEYFYFIDETEAGKFYVNSAYIPPSVDTITYELRVDEGYEYPSNIPLMIKIPIILTGGITSYKINIHNDLSISGCDYVYQDAEDSNGEYKELILANFNSDEIKMNIKVTPKSTE